MLYVAPMTHIRRIAWIVVAVLLVLYLAQPTIERLLFQTTTPRPVAPRADLADLERSTVSLFERVAPSVVQVVSLPAAACAKADRASAAAPASSGTPPATSSPTTT